MSDLRILVVEDDPDGQEMVTTVLEHLDYAVDTADDGEQALSILFDSGEHYDAIIIDLALPGINGWELVSEIRNNPQTESMPCIAVTAFHNNNLPREALTSGFTAYLPKPIDRNRLAEEIERAI